VLGFTLGSESDNEVTRLWEDDRLEVSYLLSAYSAALAESMRSRYTRALARWAEDQGRSLLTPEGPGYGDWPTAHLKELYGYLASLPGSDLCGHLKLAPTGAMSPLQSMLLVYGVSNDIDANVRETHQVNPCSRCRMPSCKIRRTAYNPTPTRDRLTAG